MAHPRDPVICQTAEVHPLPGSVGGRGWTYLFLIWGCGPVSRLAGSLEGLLSALWAPEQGGGASLRVTCDVTQPLLQRQRPSGSWGCLLCRTVRPWQAQDVGQPALLLSHYRVGLRARLADRKENPCSQVWELCGGQPAPRGKYLCEEPRGEAGSTWGVPEP